MEIPEIGTKDIQIRQLDIPPIISVLDGPSVSIPYAPPVVVNIGLPIVNIPGCVEARESDSKTLPKDDESGNIVFCDGTVPSFNPLNYEPNQIVPIDPPKVNTPKQQPKTPPVDELPIPKTPPVTAVIECPTPGQVAKEPVGTYLEGFRKQVTGYELIGNECVQITEAVPLPRQIIAGLPAAGVVVTTSSIAVVATASALMAKPLADVLLKVIKPTVKKVMKKIAAIRGKKVPALSVTERRDLQRERTEAIRALKKVLKPKG